MASTDYFINILTIPKKACLNQDSIIHIQIIIIYSNTKNLIVYLKLGPIALPVPTRIAKVWGIRIGVVSFLRLEFVLSTTLYY
jgi:hypothetical protein